MDQPPLLGDVVQIAGATRHLVGHVQIIELLAWATEDNACQLNFLSRDAVIMVCFIALPALLVPLFTFDRSLLLEYDVCIATAVVSSRLDYCNSLYHNIALKDIMKVQHVQNC